MSYLVIARKYRPSTFEDVIGQEHVTKTLINSINQDKVHHAYIFTGPRGVGKTTVSRVLAKALNCETGITSTPCGVCKNCKEIEQGSSLDIKEIDGASNRGIDEIRDLRDDIKFSPASCRKKIYIIDEVHMLTNAAFNALLKTLEEPPSHALFIFATTEINDVPATILSRCQRHDFRRVDIDILKESLKLICEQENISIDDESLLMIARNGDGSVRDSQSVLDQVIAYCGSEITGELTAEALGIPAFELYFKFLDILHKKDSRKLLIYIDKTLNEGTNLLAFFKGLLEFFRNLLISKATSDDIVLPLTVENIKRLQKYNNSFEELDLLYFLDIISKGLVTLKNSSLQRIDFEIILLKILHYEPASKLDELISKLTLLEGEGEADAALLKQDILSDILKDSKIKIEKSVNAEKAVSSEKAVETVKLEKSVKAESSVKVEKAVEIEETEAKIISEIKVVEPEKEIIVEKKNIEESVVEKITTNETEIIETEEQKTVEPETKKLDLQIIKENWLDLSSYVLKNIPMLGKSWEYCVPFEFNNNVLQCKVSKEHSTYRDILQNRTTDLNKTFNEYFKFINSNGEMIVKYEIGEINDNERFFKIIEEVKEQTSEEKQTELLEKEPQLQFLFDEPLSCKVVK